MLNFGDILDERYEILSKIGQGGMSVVFRAMDLKLEREVAVKILKEEYSEDADFIERFNNEARTAAALSHPNIVSIYDIVNSHGRYYIVMELVEGITLKNYISKKGRLSNRETIGIAIQTAEGLAEAHKNGIIHRDVKPGNIIISRDGKIKVADFGIAEALSAERKEKDAIIGSAHYMAPEQAGTGNADVRTDLYSLGITMYEMITGRLPYQGDNAENVVKAHIQDALVPPKVYASDIFPALNDIIVKSTRKNPEERYQRAEDLISDLKKAADNPERHFVKIFDAEPSSAVNKEPEPAVTEDFLDEAAEPEPDEDKKESAGGGGNFRNIIAAALVLILIISAAALFITGPDGKTSGNPETRETETEEERSEADVINYTLNIEGEDIMPDLTGMTVNEARAKMATLSLSMDSSATEYSDDYPEGTIINQSPAKNEILTRNTMVYVTVSLGGRRQYALDHIAGLSEDEARQELSEAGIEVSDVPESRFSDEVEEGLVITHTDTGGAEEVDEVTLVVSLGSESNYVTMPDLTGIPKEDAENTLISSGLVFGTASAVNTEETPENLVFSQSVAAGISIKKGTSVDLQISVSPSRGIADGEVLESGLELIENESGQQGALSSDYWYGNIDTVCVVGTTEGPGSGANINVAVRLAQRVDGSLEYTTLNEAIPVSGGDVIPVTFKNVQGVYDVPSGTVEVYDADSGEIYGSFEIEFHPAE